MIQSTTDDLHAQSVAWALQQFGIGCDIWVPWGPDIPDLEVLVGSDGRAEIRSGAPPHPIEQYRSFWMRRTPPALPDHDLSPEDLKFLAQEDHYFRRGVLSLTQRIPLVANPVHTRVHSPLKIAQLLAAKSCGLRIPDTLVSDDPDAVREFIRNCPGPVIYKSQTPSAWTDGARTRSLYTTVINLDDLDGVTAAEFNPGIFQELIPKKFELRLSVFGHTIVAARIRNQNAIDWRIDHLMEVDPHSLPADVAGKILRLLERLNLVMGMIDMIVTPDNEYVFLEVNPQGQFLWVEHMNPEIPVLQTCARFLASGDPHFRSNDGDPVIATFAQFRQVSEAALRRSRCIPASSIGVRAGC